MRDDAQPLQPGEFRDVDVPGGNIQDQFMQLPFKGPDQTLLQLLNGCGRYQEHKDLHLLLMHKLEI